MIEPILSVLIRRSSHRSAASLLERLVGHSIIASPRKTKQHGDPGKEAPRATGEDEDLIDVLLNALVAA